jgi:hypothetical protein
MCFGILGGVENRWECLISGPCIHELSECLDDAPSTQAVMTDACFDVLRSYEASNNNSIQTQEVGAAEAIVVMGSDGPYQVQVLMLPSGNVRIIDIAFDALRAKQASFLEGPPPSAPTPDAHQQSVIDALVRQFVPAPIVEELDSATGLSYFAEIREVVTMFMKVSFPVLIGLCAQIFSYVLLCYAQWDSYDSTDRHRDLLELQPCFYQAQRILHASGAYLRQFLVDDKGCVLIACWGMPHLTFLDNAHRAVGAAAQIQAELLHKRMQTSVGITCADVYCGTVGSMERMEYAAIGSEVNMAARIMGKAKGRLLVGQSCFDRLPKGDLEHLDAIEPMKVKGKSEPLQAYCYVASHSRKVRQEANATAALDIAPAARVPLQALLTNLSSMPLSPPPGAKSPYTFSSPGAAENSHAGSSRSAFHSTSLLTFRSPFTLRTTRNPAPIVLINGKRGTGKSSVAAWLRAHAAEHDIFTVGARMTKQTSSKPYFLWKKVFHQLSARADFRSNDGQWSHVNELFHEVFPNLAQLTEHVSLSSMSDALGVGTTFSDKVGRGSTDDFESDGFESKRSNASHSRKPASVHDAENLRDALVKIFAHLLGQQPSLLLVENVHLADEQSLGLLSKLVQRISHPNAVVLTALVPDERGSNSTAITPSSHGSASSAATHFKSQAPMVREQSSLSDKVAAVQADSLNNTAWCRKFQGPLLKRRGTMVLTLSNYTRGDIDDMLLETLKVQSVPPEISQLVQDFSGGSYFWVREILRFIKEHGAEQFLSAIGEEGHAAAAAHSDVSKQQIAPRRSSIALAPALQRDSVLARQILVPTFQSANSHRVISSPHQVHLDKLVLVRFGGLPPDAQRVLRTASIIGVTFTADVLHAALPAHLKAEVPDCLHSLVIQMWLYEDLDNEQLYTFAHPHAQQIVYELTPASERNNLYAQIAEYVEKNHGTEPTQYVALSHYFLHCDTDKSLQYAVRAHTALLAVTSVYDFADAVNLIGSSLPACKTTYDVDVLLKLHTECKRSIEHFGYTWVTPKHHTDFTGEGSWSRFFSCLQSGSTKVTPTKHSHASSESSTTVSTAPSTSGSYTHSEKRRKFKQMMQQGRAHSHDDLQQQEQAARALFLKQLDRISSQLSTIYVELAEAAEAGEEMVPRDWQMSFLGLLQLTEAE